MSSIEESMRKSFFEHFFNGQEIDLSTKTKTSWFKKLIQFVSK